MSRAARSSNSSAWNRGALMLMKPVSRAVAEADSASIWACVSVVPTSWAMFR